MSHEWEYQGQFSGGYFMYRCNACTVEIGVDRGKEETIEEAMMRNEISSDCITINSHE